MATPWWATAAALVAVVVAGCGGDGGTGPGETQGATLAVGVVTSGDPSPATDYTVRVNGSVTRSVGTTGSVTFTDLAPGSVQVGLESMPVHCAVVGPNPRSVSAPGQTTFEVVCQPPVLCGEPPGDSFMDSGTGATPGEGGSGAAQILTIDWSEVSVRATSNAPLDGLGPEQYAESRSHDYVFVQPVDPNRIGDEVRVDVHVQGLLEVTGDPHAVTEPRGYVTFDQQVIFEIPGFQSASPAAGMLDIDEVVGFDVLLGSWRVLEIFAAATATARDLTSTTVTATLRVDSIVDVRDGSGEVIPILTVCTESETEY